MQVGIDITSIMYQRGVSRYTSNLVRALSKQPETVLNLYGYSWRQHHSLQAEAQSLLGSQASKHQVTVQRIPPTALSWLWKLGLARVSSTLPSIDVFHSWDWLQPPDKKLPLVTTIHDLALLHYPETAHPKIEQMHQRAWKALKKRPDAQIIAVSQATKKDIVNLLEIDPQRVHVIYEALPSETVLTSKELKEEDYDQLRAKLQLTKPYILFVGTREPRKNLETLVQAWQKLAKDYDLLIAGDPGWDDSASFSFQHQPRFLGRVSNPELAVLYQEAAVFAYPSLYEGFGLPILEAFYHGTPVVTSNISSMPEVAGNAAELVDPFSDSSVYQGLETILNESQKKRQVRLKQMILRLQLFDWASVAKQTTHVYKQAINANSTKY